MRTPSFLATIACAAVMAPMIASAIFAFPAVAADGFEKNATKNGIETGLGPDRVLFVTTPKWYRLSRSAREDDVLITRKYAVSVIDGKVLTDPASVKNVYDFGCQRTTRHLDYVVFHFPEWVELKDVKRSDWIPKMKLNIALDGRKNTFDAEGEYKNGSLFLDLDEAHRDNLLRLLIADEAIVQLPSGERLTILQRERTPDGKGDIAGFVNEVVPIIAKTVDAGRVSSMSVKEMLDGCLAYRRTGRY